MSEEIRRHLVSLVQIAINVQDWCHDPSAIQDAVYDARATLAMIDSLNRPRVMAKGDPPPDNRW